MIAKWEKIGKSYKGFIFFPKSKTTIKKRPIHTHSSLKNRIVFYSDSDSDSDSENENENENEIDYDYKNAYSWWNPISWIY